jgi:RNA polymerase sigma-70 factor (ECF subfamily)
MHDLATADLAARQEQASLLQQKDGAFWETVIQEVQRVAYALRNYYNLERAELTSAILEHVWEKRGCYQPAKGSLRQWVIALAQNLAKDMLKSRRHKSLLLQARSGYDGLAAEHRAEPAYPRDEEQHLDEILAGLSPHDREIILEHSRTDGAGRWAADLAERLGIQASTIRVKRVRAHERIKQAFRERGYNPTGA